MQSCKICSIANPKSLKFHMRRVNDVLSMNKDLIQAQSFVEIVVNLVVPIFVFIKLNFQ